MVRTLYLDCFSGISGDMFLGALLDLGVPLDVVTSALDSLHLPEPLHLHADRQLRGSVSGIKVDVHVHSHKTPHHHSHPHSSHDSHEHHGRSYTTIKDLIEKASLDPWVKQHAISIFRRIGEVEAAIHHKTLNEIHFHEVGALDSIADIVGACAALHYLKVETILASNLVEGTGTLHCEHGLFPIPAPATLALLQSTGASLKQLDHPYELITPTGAAILAEFAQSFAPLNNFQIEKIGWGLGTREIPGRPNALRVLLGKTSDPVTGVPGLSPLESDTVAVLETNLDDCSGESLGYLSDVLFKAGAYDVAYSPLTMKKSRPAWQLQVITPLHLKHSLAEIILRQSSAFGLRVTEVERLKLSREIKTITTPYGDVRVKIGKIGDETIKTIPEYEDCKTIAQEKGIGLETVYRACLPIPPKEF
jgi:pyridinium-3,5-bisthiocarboxylic acid mononucleotide nickel chelatase